MSALPAPRPLSPPPTDRNPGVAPYPPAPWIVNEDEEPWPVEVAEGTWHWRYPDHDGPEKMTTLLHVVDLRAVRHAVEWHMERREVARSQAFWLSDNSRVGWEDWGHYLPDLMLYLRARPEGVEHFDVAQHGPPALAVEFLSRGTWRNDVGWKVAPRANKIVRYAETGIQEYWIVNSHPTDIRQPRLQGFRLDPGRQAYVPIASEGGLVQRGTGDVFRRGRR